MEFFLHLTLYFQLFTITTWLISAPNINQSTFGIDQMELYGPLDIQGSKLTILYTQFPISEYVNLVLSSLMLDKCIRITDTISELS